MATIQLAEADVLKTASTVPLLWSVDGGVKEPWFDYDDEGNPVKEERVILPTKDDVLLSDDILIVVGRNSDLDAFREMS